MGEIRDFSFIRYGNFERLCNLKSAARLFGGGNGGSPGFFFGQSAEFVRTKVWVERTLLVLRFLLTLIII
jgi:hypothetical protein